jgi:hypothetical protein
VEEEEEWRDEEISFIKGNTIESSKTGLLLRLRILIEDRQKDPLTYFSGQIEHVMEEIIAQAKGKDNIALEDERHKYKSFTDMLEYQNRMLMDIKDSREIIPDSWWCYKEHCL